MQKTFTPILLLILFSFDATLGSDENNIEFKLDRTTPAIEEGFLEGAQFAIASTCVSHMLGAGNSSIVFGALGGSVWGLYCANYKRERIRGIEKYGQYLASFRQRCSEEAVKLEYAQTIDFAHFFFDSCDPDKKNAKMPKSIEELSENIKLLRTYSETISKKIRGNRCGWEYWYDFAQLDCFDPTVWRSYAHKDIGSPHRIDFRYRLEGVKILDEDIEKASPVGKDNEEKIKAFNNLNFKAWDPYVRLGAIYDAVKSDKFMNTRLKIKKHNKIQKKLISPNRYPYRNINDYEVNECRKLISDYNKIEHAGVFNHLFPSLELNYQLVINDIDSKYKKLINTVLENVDTETYVKQIVKHRKMISEYKQITSSNFPFKSYIIPKDNVLYLLKNRLFLKTIAPLKIKAPLTVLSLQKIEKKYKKDICRIQLWEKIILHCSKGDCYTIVSTLFPQGNKALKDELEEHKSKLTAKKNDLEKHWIPLAQNPDTKDDVLSTLVEKEQ